VVLSIPISQLTFSIRRLTARLRLCAQARPFKAKILIRLVLDAGTNIIVARPGLRRLAMRSSERLPGIGQM
jgi:hypothetical protein